MKQLKTQNSKEIIVNTSTGEAYISNRRLSVLIDVPESTLRDYFRAQKIVITQGVSSDLLSITAQHFAEKGNMTALKFMGMISKAGAKAYLYHEAGYSVSASPVKPMALPTDYVSALRALADETEQKIILLEENTEKRIITDEGEEYFSAKRIKELNNGAKIGGVKLARSAAKLGIPPKQMFTHYEDFNTPIAWHISVWIDAYPNINYPN